MTEGSLGTAQEPPLQQLGLQQPRQQIVRLERHILEFRQDGYARPLCDSLEESLAATAELVARKPESQALDQGIARHKQASKARQVAEQNLAKTQESFRLGTAAFEQTKIADDTPSQLLVRMGLPGQHLAGDFSRWRRCSF